MKTKSILLFYLLFPILAPAQTVDFERDSLLVELPYANVLQVLASQVPGFYISPADNSEGDMSATMTLRGMNVVPQSKTAESKQVNAPLIVVDGVVFTGSISEISTADVVKVEVLKDASAFYGTRGGNGAIIITTRKGKTSKPSVRFNAGGSVSDWSHRPDGVNEDWTDYISRKGIGQQYDLSVSGCTKRVNYYVSGDYTRQQGILLGDDYRKAGGLAKVEYHPLAWIELGIKASYTSGHRWGQTPRLQNAFYMKEPSSKYSEVPGYENWPNSQPDGYTYNPLIGNGAFQSNLYTDRRSFFNNYGGEIYTKLDFPFLKGLSWWLSYDMQKNLWKEEAGDDPRIFVNTRDASQMDNPDMYGALVKWSDSEKDWHRGNVSTCLDYRALFGKHSLRAVAGYNREQFDRVTVTNKYTGPTLSTATSYYMSKQVIPTTTLTGLYASMSYDYASRLFASASVYNEGFLYESAEVTGCNTYYKFGIGASIIPENLMLRGSYGFDEKKRLAYAGLWFANLEKLELGLDYALAGGRITGSLEAYKNISCSEYPSIFFGGTEYTSDLSVSNTGIEFAVRSINLAGDGRRTLLWESHLLVAANRNRIEKLYGKTDNMDIANALAYGYDMYYAMSAGKPIDYIYLEPKTTAEDFIYVGDQDPQLVVNLGNTVAWKKASLWINLRCAYGREGHFLGYDTVGQEWVSRNYLKLSDLVLSYNVYKGINIYLSGANLVTFTNWPALDPENGGTIAASWVSDRFQCLPTFRTLRLGITSTF